MSDPFERLRDALGDVAVPDQWSAIESRAAAGDLPSPTVGKARRRTLAWWSAAAAACALVATGIVVLANRETADAPATPPPGDTVPPPAPSMPCRTEADLATIAATINLGLVTVDSGPQPSSAVSQLDASVVLDATATTIERSGEFVQLTLADVTYHRGGGPVDAVSQRVPAWEDSAGPDPLAEPIDLAGVRVIAGVEPLSSAPVWSPPPGSFFVGCAGTDIPAIDVHNGAALLGDPSIDELAGVLVTGVPTPTAPVTEPPPTTTATGATMPCASDADLDAVLDALPGVANDDFVPAETLADLLDSVDTVFRARLASADRAADGSAILHVADAEHLAGEQAVVTAVRLVTTWPQGAGPDRLGGATTFDGVELVVFADRVDGVSPSWVPDVQGIFAGCAGGASGVRPIGQPAAFLDHSSLDALASQVVSSTAADSGPWGRPCVDRIGNSEPPAGDLLAEQPFGPLAAEPGLTVLYSFGSQAPMYSAPVSSVSRVPGGLLIRMLSSGPDGSDRIVAVVNDDGSVRWRRCFTGLYGWSAAVADDVAHLEMGADGSTETEWWSFDLATGESTVDAGPPAELDGTSNGGLPEVFFHFDPVGPQSPLSRRTADGRELWRRDDLFDPGGEGFRTSEPQATSAGEIVLVRACDGIPNGSSELPSGEQCPQVLLGIDADNGATVWQLDGFYSVVLVADGYAIVNTAGTPTPSVSMLLDVATGEFVPDGVSDAPGAFYEECCGGYDYNRVESARALAWTIAYDHLDVWLPAGAPGRGATVDLLGPAATPTVFAHWGYPVFDQPACSAPTCRFLNAVGSGFEPGSTVTAECWGRPGGEWQRFSSPFTLTVSPDGSVAVNDVCWYGHTGTPAKVVIDGVESGAITN